jgi:uncharacterized protein (DUF1330 family)
MKVLVLTSWDNPKCEEGLKKYYEYNSKHREYLTKRREKYNVKSSSWSDGTGKMYWLREFESFEDYAKFMDDEEYQKIMIHAFRNVNNGKIKVLREAISAPP